jgi:carbonic anhydrase
MKRILDGLTRFQTEIFPEEKELFTRLASGQSPEALFLTCSDSRIVPDLMTQTKPGDLFICRNAGNIAPPYGEPAGGVSATIEYAVLALGVRDIIVCGHSDCGAMRGVMEPKKLEGMPTVASWLRHAERSRFVMQEHFGHLNGQAYLEALTEQNVLAQLDNLRTHPSVASRLHGGKLNLHGWVYEIETGVVRAYDAGAGRFVPIRDTRGDAPAMRGVDSEEVSHARA